MRTKLLLAEEEKGSLNLFPTTMWCQETKKGVGKFAYVVQLGTQESLTP